MTGFESIIIPDGIEPVIGCRFWQVSADGFLLPANTFSLSWPPRERYRARCTKNANDRNHEEFDAPHSGCGCGIYILTHEGIERYLRPGSVLNGKDPVYGLVAGWGRVEEAERGWRVEFAYPKELVVLEGRTSRAAEKALLLREHYGIPVDLLTDNKLSQWIKSVKA